MFPAQTMKVTAALHTVEQHSEPGCCSQTSDMSKATGQESDLQAWRAHLSESWNARQGCSDLLARTMRVAAALHTLGQRFQLGRLLASLKAVKTGWQRKVHCVFKGRTCQVVEVQVKRAQCSQQGPREWQLPCTPLDNIRPGCLQAELTGVRHVSREKRPTGSEGAPVRELECMSRVLRFLSADHEGGSGPAHNQAAFTTMMRACRDKSCERRQQTEATCGL